MKTSLDCLPCLLRQATDAIRLGAKGRDVDIMAVRELLLASTTLDFEQSPPQLSGTLQAQLRTITGCADPYRAAKDRFNRLALRLVPGLAARVAASRDPFAAAVRLAIAGNIIDLGAKSGLTEEEASTVATQALAQPVRGAMAALRRAAAQARHILYLCDNAGEIIFDRVLIERLPRGRVTAVVRGHPVINDATREDAELAGLPAHAEIIDNGSAMPGTVLADCSPEFRRRFAEADLVIAKGQGNFESLHGHDAPLFCLFRVKCPIVADRCGHPLGSHVIWHPRRAPARAVGNPVLRLPRPSRMRER